MDHTNCLQVAIKTIQFNKNEKSGNDQDYVTRTDTGDPDVASESRSPRHWGIHNQGHGTRDD
jgi:hypothetical protein